MDLLAELKLVVGEFERRRLRYALCGGLAVAVHGAPRATKDIDLLALPDDLDAIKEAARSCGYPFAGTPFRFRSTGITVQRFTKLVDGSPLILDVLLADDSLRAALDAAEPRRLDDATLNVIRIADLKAMKVNAGRPQDLADLERLKDVHDDPA